MADGRPDRTLIPTDLRKHLVTDAFGPHKFHIEREDEFTRDELMLIASLGVELNIAPGNQLFDLTALEEPLLTARGISIWGGGTQGSTSSSYRGWELLERCDQLVDLFLWEDPPTAIDLSGLPRLGRVRVPGPNSQSALANPNLKGLDVETQLPEWPRVTARLREFAAIGVTGLDFLDQVEDLESIYVASSALVDCSVLADCTRLSEVRLIDVWEVRGLDVIIPMPTLRWLVLDGVDQFGPVEAFTGEYSPALVVDIVNNSSLPEEVAAPLRERPRWSVPSLRPKRASLKNSPFSIEKADGTGGYEVSFDDWGALALRLGVEQGGPRVEFMERVVTVAARQCDPPVPVEFDSDGGIVFALVPSRTQAGMLHRVLIRLWNQPADLNTAGGGLGRV